MEEQEPVKVDSSLSPQVLEALGITADKLEQIIEDAKPRDVWLVIIALSHPFLYRALYTNEVRKIQSQMTVKEMQFAAGLSQEELEQSQADMQAELDAYAQILYCESGCLCPSNYNFRDPAIIPGIPVNLSYRIQEVSGISDFGMVKKVSSRNGS